MKTIVITGANAGIGRTAALELAGLGHRVVLVCRNQAKGEEAMNAIRAATGNETVGLVVGDLGAISGTRAAAQRILETCPRIDVLVNNAGVWPAKRALNTDGLETAFMVNHLAPFILSNALLDRLKDSAPARIVNVNAGLYVKGDADLEALPAGKNFHRFKTYMHTKLCNVLFTVELARRLEGTGVTVNALHPGVIRTNLGDTTGPIGLLLRFAKRFWESPEDGAKPVVYLAVSDEVAGVSGKYYDKFKPIPIDTKAMDESLAQRLWEVSAQLAATA